MNDEMRQPQSVQEAIELMKEAMTADLLAEIKAGDERTLYRLHHSVGMQIRNAYGLWTGNTALRADCLERAKAEGQELTPLDQGAIASDYSIHPDDASHALLRAFQKHIQEVGP